MNNRKQNLMDYIKLLKELKRDGFKCEQELSQAIKELHMLMHIKGKFNKPNKRILVVEDTREGVDNSVNIFKSILDITSGVSNSNLGVYTLFSDNATVNIFLADELNSNSLRGTSFDYVITNTEKPIDLSYFGLKIN